MPANTIAHKTSIKVPYQLPEFIRSDGNYQTFVAFLQAYYEWMEQQNIGSGKEGAIYGSQSLYGYTDIDSVEPGQTYNKFIDYYFNDFLPNFPTDALADKAKLIKIARQLYQSKGTPASYQFLFRALYNSDADIFLTRDVVFKASDGKWYVSKSLKLDTEDSQFLSIDNLRLFGETSKSIATVERGIRSGTRIEVYISNIERIFQSGEIVRVVDNNNQTLYFKDGEVVPEGTVGSSSLSAKIIGSISSVQINSKKRGQLYRGRSATYSGDPVVFYGGLNPDTANPIAAEAYVLETTSGSISSVGVVDGSYGYREDPNTQIRFVGGGGSGAIANVSSVDPAGLINVAFIPKDYFSTTAQATQIGGIYSFFTANTSANANCTLANAFSFTAFATYPISAVAVNNGGGGYTSVPAVIADSLYDTTDPEPIAGLKKKGKLASLGILGPIEIVTPGTGYANGNIITFTNGAGGVGANAYVNVNATGSIVSATYIYSNTTSAVTRYPLGGFGYRMDSLPSLNVSTSGGSGGVLRVNQVLGAGAELSSTPDERGIGAITSFIVENYGEDYVSAPSVSLKVRDLVVANLTLAQLPVNGDIIYQGANLNTAVFRANVDSIKILSTDANPLLTKYILRTYNYTSNTKTNLQLKITDRGSSLPNLYIDLANTYDTLDDSGNYLFRNGIRTYGNGAAQATARFLNGLIIGNGQYLKDDGFPSSFQVLEDENNNNFTYDLIVQKSFDAYQDALYKLLHPSGTKVVPINALKSTATINVNSESFQSNSLPLSYYTGSAGSNATVYGSFTNPSNNIIKFDALVGANIATFINVNTIISISNTHGPNLFSEIISFESIGPATNYLFQSEDFSSASWTKTRSTITSNAITAPDGTMTADKLVNDTGTGSHTVRNIPALTVVTGDTFTSSIYAKAAEHNFIIVGVGDSGGSNISRSTFDLSTGVITFSFTAATNISAPIPSITSVGNGWYRCSITVTVTGGTSAQSWYFKGSATGGASYTGDGTSGIYIWGAQLNPGSTLDRYVKTTTTSQVNVGASNTAVIRDNVFLRFANVAFANTQASNTKINITTITDQYDIINNGEWSNTQNKLQDLAFIGDEIRVYANASSDYTGTITYVSYSNNAIFVTPAPSFAANNANVWIGRNLVSTNINIYNFLGDPGIPYLTTQDGDVLTTQDNDVLTLGI